MSSRFFLNREVLYKKISDLGLLRCINEEKANYMMKELHNGVYGPHINGHLLAKKIMRIGYYVIGTIDLPAWNGYRLILVAIKYFTKWVEAAFYKQFKIRHQNFAIYRPQMNGAVETANKNLKMIIRKMTEVQRDWHEKLPYELMAYRTTIRTSTGATPYSLMYGMEAKLPAEFEIPSLRILIEAQIEEVEWIRERHE
ncbi:uncharacterized protein [Coffea arabica]|uniref:Integrase catalytic domain-containing protein n=1 Tax=Coffea arabica TaxID=13443 RepID=A0ABM4W776_COFAR